MSGTAGTECRLPEWIDELPSGWKISRLGFDCYIKARLGWRGLKAEEYVDDGFVFLATPNLKQRHIDFDHVNYITEQRYLESPEIILRVGDVLLAKDGSTLGTCNVVRVLPKPATVNSSIAVVRPQRNLDSIFLYYYLQSTVFQSTVQRMKDGMGVPHLFQEDLRSFAIIYPSIATQHRIANFLDTKTAQIDQLISKKERMIELLQEKRQALISHAVTKGLDPKVEMKDSGVEWLGKVPKSWKVVALKRAWSVIDCKHLTVSFVDEGFPVASIREVGDGVVDLSQAKRTTTPEYLTLIEGRKPKHGDIIYSRNASVGEVGYVDTDEDFCMGQDVCLITSTSHNQRYLSFQLRGSFIQQQLAALLVGATFKRINVADIKEFLICLPPDREQHHIADYCLSVEKDTNATTSLLKVQIDKLREYRQTLISAAVTGTLSLS